MSWNAHTSAQIILLCGHAPRERVSWNRDTSPNLSICFSHAPRERVSWNINVVICQREITSHAPRERVSWNVEERSRINLAGVTLHVSVWVEICLSEVRITLSLSRSTWACELKFAETCQASIESRHAPRERVSWNKEPEKPDCYPKGVTLHVSVWVEIFIDFYSNFFALRHAPRERVSWNFQCLFHNDRGRVTLHVSVWVEMCVQWFRTVELVSRSTWACELKYP